MTATPHTVGYDTCGAPKRQTEGPCTRPAGWGTQHPGLGKCKLHGGSTSSHNKAAMLAQAEALVRQQLDYSDAEPVTNPGEALQRLAGRVQHALDVMGERINDLSGVGAVDDRGAEHLRVEANVWLQLIARLESLLTNMDRLGLETKRVGLEEKHADLFAMNVMWLLECLGRNDDRGRALAGEMFGALAVGSVPSTVVAG